MATVKEKQQNMFDTLKGIFGYTNKLQTPRVERVVVSVGTGSIKDKEKIELIPDRLQKITGQRPAPRGAKKSIAGFKLRQGDIIGQVVTLRGSRKDAFLDKLFNVALPRTRDFKGISRTAVDAMGNLTIGVKEHTIFPETADEELKNVFGMAITLVSTAKSREEALKYFEEIGVPFKKEDVK